jgi:hypothetical protein
MDMTSGQLFRRVLTGLLLVLGGTAGVQADIAVRISVKFILNSDGTRPTGGIGSIEGLHRK